MIFAAKIIESEPLILQKLRKRGSTLKISNISLAQQSKKAELYLCIDKEQFLIVKLELIRAYSPSIKFQLVKDQKQIKLIAKHGQIHIIGTIEGDSTSSNQKTENPIEIASEKQKQNQIKGQTKKQQQVPIRRSSMRIRNAPPPPKYDQSKQKTKEKKDFGKKGGLLALLQAEADSEDDQSFSEQSESESSSSESVQDDLQEEKLIQSDKKSIKTEEKTNEKSPKDQKSENPEIQSNSKQIKLQNGQDQNHSRHLRKQVKIDEKIDHQEKTFPIPTGLPSFYKQSHP